MSHHPVPKYSLEALVLKGLTRRAEKKNPARARPSKEMRRMAAAATTSWILVGPKSENSATSWTARPSLSFLDNKLARARACAESSLLLIHINKFNILRLGSDEA